MLTRTHFSVWHFLLVLTGLLNCYESVFGQSAPPKKDTTVTGTPLASAGANTGTYTSKIIPASPNVAAIDKFVDIPVNNYTGTPNITVPLYTIKTRDLTVPIAIDYHGSGIRVEEEASNIGLGWALNAGGVIRHAVRGRDDFQDFNASQWRYLDSTVIQNGTALCYYFNNPNAVFFVPTTQTSSGRSLENRLNDLLVTVGGERPDSERDVFSYSFPGYSGKFLIVPLGNNQYSIRQMPQTDLRITLNTNSGGFVDVTGRSGFIIITPDGTRYVFAQEERQRSRNGATKDTGKKYKDQGIDPVLWGNPDTGFDNNNPPEHTGAWYLTEIRSQKGDIINLSYTVTANLVTGLPVRTEIYTTSQGSYYRWKISETSNRIVTINSITFDNGSVVFTNDSRDDLPSGSSRLTGMEVRTSSGSVVKRIQLNQGYFNSGSNRLGLVSKRLKLQSVQDITVPNCMPPHTFTYEETVNLPDKDSYAQDFLATLMAL